MSDRIYERDWRQCMLALSDQLILENKPVLSPTLLNYSHFACLYVRYVSLYRRLEECEAQLVLPPQREFIRSVALNVLVRMCELRNFLIFLHPRPGCRFPTVEDAVLALGLSSVDYGPPRFLRDPTRIDILNRTILHWQRVFNLSLSETVLASRPGNIKPPLSLEQAVRLIQRNERGRLGILRATSLRVWRKAGGSNDDAEKLRECIAKIVAGWRGVLSRRMLINLKQNEYRFLGMAPSVAEKNSTSQDISLATKFRQETEKKNWENRKIQDLERFRLNFGPEKKREMINERMQWIWDVRGTTGCFPSKIPDFYKKAQEPKIDENQEKPEKNEKPEKTEKNGKKEEKEKAEPPAAPPTFEFGTSAAVQDLANLIDIFGRTVSWTVQGNETQPLIEEEARLSADLECGGALENARNLFDGMKKEKGKKSKKAKKSKKPKKPKKWCAAEGLLTSAEDCFTDLVNDGIVRLVKPAFLSEFTAPLSPLYSAQLTSDTYLPCPSYPAIRAMILEHAILPLGSTLIRQRSPLVAKSILMFGPSGNGKSLIARAIATEIGAAFFDISPSTVGEKYSEGKDGGGALLIWKLYLAARKHAPSVIYMEDVEKLFPVKKKNDSLVSHARFKRDLLAFLKQIKTGSKATDDDRILFIGTSGIPTAEGVDQTELAAAFDEHLWISFPDYGTRVELWLIAMEARGLPKSITRSAAFNVSALAAFSEGFSCEAIKRSVERVLTARRVKLAIDGVRDVEVNELIESLCKEQPCSPEEWVQFREFNHDATGERARQKNADGKEKKAAKKKKA